MTGNEYTPTTPLRALNGTLSTRAYNALHHGGYTTVEAVADADVTDLLALRALGPITVAEIRTVVCQALGRPLPTSDPGYGTPDVFAETLPGVSRWVVVLDGKRIVAGAQTETEARKMADNWLLFFPTRPADWSDYTDDHR